MTTELKKTATSIVVSMLAIDAVLIIVFAVIGVSSHDGDLSITTIARVAIPFLVPYLVLASAIKPQQLIHNIFPAGIALWVITVVLGPILRAVFFSDTSATAFVMVAAGVLAVLLLGRRIISTLVTRRSETA